MRHRGMPSGAFRLADNEAGQKFTSEDEDVLAMFASCVGAAIDNARKHRDTQRALAGRGGEGPQRSPGLGMR